MAERFITPQELEEAARDAGRVAAELRQGAIDTRKAHDVLSKVLARLVAERDEALAVLATCRRIVAAQAGDAALWDPQTVVEGYLVQELRTLHRAVEGDATAVAAVEDL